MRVAKGRGSICRAIVVRMKAVVRRSNMRTVIIAGEMAIMTKGMTASRRGGNCGFLSVGDQVDARTFEALHVYRSLGVKEKRFDDELSSELLIMTTPCWEPLREVLVCAHYVPMLIPTTDYLFIGDDINEGDPVAISLPPIVRQKRVFVAKL
jgi:hypothetical protein